LTGHLWSDAHFEGGGNGGAGRDPAGDAFVPRERACSLKRGLIADGQHLVDEGTIKDVGNEPGAYALNLMWPGLAAGKNRAVFRLDSDHAKRRLSGLQHLADAGNGAPRADA